jgi:hypothetical protein
MLLVDANCSKLENCRYWKIALSKGLGSALRCRLFSPTLQQNIEEPSYFSILENYKRVDVSKLYVCHCRTPNNFI